MIKFGAEVTPTTLDGGPLARVIGGRHVNAVNGVVDIEGSIEHTGNGQREDGKTPCILLQKLISFGLPAECRPENNVR